MNSLPEKWPCFRMKLIKARKHKDGAQRCVTHCPRKVLMLSSLKSGALIPKFNNMINDHYWAFMFLLDVHF